MATICKTLLLLLFTAISNGTNDSIIDTRPKVQQTWIYFMMILGWFGFIISIFIIGYSLYQTKLIQNTPRALIMLYFTLWTCNLIACFQWATLRTSVFVELTTSLCTVFYISNYLFYMIGKYCLHLLLIHRFYIAFRETPKSLNKSCTTIILTIISINFLVFTSLWISTCLAHVEVGVIVPNYNVEICTLFNNSNKDLTLFDVVWPILLGGQDFIVGCFTLSLFIWKIHGLEPI
eukprot:UN12057